MGLLSQFFYNVIWGKYLLQVSQEKGFHFLLLDLHYTYPIIHNGMGNRNLGEKLVLELP